MKFFNFKSKLDKFVAVIGVIFICIFSVLLIDFFIEQVSGAGWVNVGMIIITMFLALPVCSVLPLWIILITKKEKSLFSILAFVLALVLFMVCACIGWVYPE